MAGNGGPLTGLKVIELAHIMAGPACGLMLADMGADVIKVEKVPGGDDSRRFLPPDIDGESAAFMMMNRNKRGIAVFLRPPTWLSKIIGSTPWISWAWVMTILSRKTPA